MKSLRILLCCVVCLMITDAALGRSYKTVTYEEIDEAPSDYKGKYVKFKYTFRGFEKGIGGIFSRHGKSEESYVLFASEWEHRRPTLRLLLKKTLSAYKTAKAAEKGDTLYIYGRVSSLTRNSGDKVYYLDVYSVKKPAKSKVKYEEADAEDIGKDPTEYKGKSIAVTVRFYKQQKKPSRVVVVSLRLDESECVQLQTDLDGVDIIVKRDNEEAIEILDDIERGDRITVFGTVNLAEFREWQSIYILADKIEEASGSENETDEDDDDESPPPPRKRKPPRKPWK